MDPFKEHKSEQPRTPTGDPDKRTIKAGIKAPHHLSDCGGNREESLKMRKKSLKKHRVILGDGGNTGSGEESLGDAHGGDAAWSVGGWK